LADRIKGITVEIGGDTVGLDKALKGVNNTSRNLQKELRDVQKLLKFDPNNVELMAQKQKLLNDQIENTEKKLNQLKEAESQVQAQFERGDIGAEQYRAFQRELQDTAQYLQHTQNQLNDLSNEQQKVQSSTQELGRLFLATNSSLEEYADTLGTKLVRAIQNGTASSKDLDKAFDLVSRSALGAGADVAEVREKLKALENGDKSVKKVSKSLQKLASDAADAKDSVKDLGGELGGIAAGAAGIVGIGGIIQKALDISTLDTTIDISFQVPEESKQSVKDAVHGIQAYGIDAETALAGVRKQWQLNANLTNEENAALVKGAGTIAAAYSAIDFTELIQESNEMAIGMEMSQEEALGMTKALLDIGFPPEQLDIISEYGSNLARAGYDAQEIQAIMATGIETGTWNIDNLLDGLQEGRILMSEFGNGVDKATGELLAKTEISKTQLQEWGAAIAGGGNAGKEAMVQVATALAGVDDATTQNLLGVKFFGTMWETQGQNIITTLTEAEGKTVDLTTQSTNLANASNSLDASPQVALNNALQGMTDALTPLLTTVATYITKVAEWAQKNPTLAATIAAVTTGIGLLVGILFALSPILTAVIALAGALGISVSAIAAPVYIAIAAIAAIIAIGVLLYKNWDTIKKKAGELASTISKKFEEFKKAAGDKMKAAQDKIEDIWDGVMKFFKNIDLYKIGKNIIQGLIDGITAMGEKVKKAASNIASGIGEKVSKILDLGSPSKVMIGYGEDAGVGLAIGLKNTIGTVSETATSMANSLVKAVDSTIGRVGKVVTTTKSLAENLISSATDFLGGGKVVQDYFKAIVEDGDWLNDWLTNMPKQVANLARQLGSSLSKDLEGSNAFGWNQSKDPWVTKPKPNLNVTINSPRQLDAREANVVWNKTMKKMQLQW
jgi:phage-related minor tail protein